MHSNLEKVCCKVYKPGYVSCNFFLLCCSNGDYFEAACLKKLPKGVVFQLVDKWELV